MNYKQWLYQLSYKKRIWISFVILITLAISTTGTMTYFIAASVLKRNASELSQNSLNKSAQVFDEKLRQIIVSVMTLTISESFKDIIKNTSAGDKQNYYQLLSSIQTPFSQIQALEPAVQSILITTSIGEFYPTNYVRLKENSFFNTDMYRLITEYQHAIWIEGHEDTFFRRKEKVITLVMQPLTENQNSEIYIIVNIKEQALIDMLLKNVEETDQRFHLVSSKGDPVFFSQSRFSSFFNESGFVENINRDTKGSFEYKGTKQSYLVNYASLSLAEDWILLSVQSKSDLLKQIRMIKWVSILIMIGCLLLSIIYSNILTAVLLKPLLKLRNLMVKVEHTNDLTVRFESEYRDEVSQVGRKFNSMLEELALSIKETGEIEIKKRKAEIKALQAQIDPHFLYNTLNTIYWKAQLNQSDDVKEMVLSLSRMFQLGLNNGFDYTTLEKEIDHVKQYLFIQKKCYTNLFDYNVVVDVEKECIVDITILKVILQPLVENSILHGFKNRKSGGIIDILIRKTEEHLIIAVEDNGSGMNVDEIKQSLQVPTQKTGYALRNIYHRLQLYYGGDSEMIFESVPDQKTTITLIINMKGRDGYGETD
ncbi:two-component system sensor histidine kinase YesM [Paenibacillus castaneae]|uniref:sensor histidine kinase n=1 Tax=Paenibacillus castaneae TaxID=474957 RepID=UPI000C99879D|nr:sensor histidine kinase [Paenibacillus castaneae]NIK79559.1 two-component system sensor histidine kinase YesM [Paenibacillus castaneae]